MSDEMADGIDSILRENRVFDPPKDVGERLGGAWIADMEAYRTRWQESIDDPEAFWDREAKQHLHWFDPYHTVLEWDCTDAKWFLGMTNACHTCVDRQVEDGHGATSPSSGRANRSGTRVPRSSG